MTKLPTPIAKQGLVAGRHANHRARSRQEVARRAKGKCVGCGKLVLPAPDWAHLVGRRNIVGEPWASSPELTTSLCRQCHHLMDSNIDIDLRDGLRLDGLDRLIETAVKHNVNVQGIKQIGNEDPLAAIVRLVNRLEDAGVQPDCCPEHNMKVAMPRQRGFE